MHTAGAHQYLVEDGMRVADSEHPQRPPIHANIPLSAATTISTAPPAPHFPTRNCCGSSHLSARCHPAGVQDRAHSPTWWPPHCHWALPHPGKSFPLTLPGKSSHLPPAPLLTHLEASGKRNGSAQWQRQGPNSRGPHLVKRKERWAQGGSRCLEA